MMINVSVIKFVKAVYVNWSSSSSSNSSSSSSNDGGGVHGSNGDDGDGGGSSSSKNNIYWVQFLKHGSKSIFPPSPILTNVSLQHNWGCYTADPLNYLY